MKTAALALLTCLLAAPSAQRDDPGPPSSREQKALLESLLSLDVHKRKDRQEMASLLEPYAAVPAPEGSKRKRLLKDITKRWSKQRLLPEKKGEYWYWEEDHKGRFFLAGELRKPKGLFIGLHGGGVGSANAAGAHGSYASQAGARDWLAIFPQAIAATERGWTDTGTEEWIMDLIDQARRTFDIPPERVYIGGHSMGGYGSWVLGAHHADLFAAAVPSAGAPTPIYNSDGSIYAIQKGVVPNLRNLPMCVFQSTDDPRVPPDVNQAAVRDVEKAKAEWGGYEHFDYWEVEDRGHSFPVGGTDALLERIQDHERDAHPTKIVWQPSLSWKTTFYWLDWPEPRIDAIVVAELDRDANSIAVTSDGSSVKGLGILLSSAVVDLEKEVVVTLDGEEVFRGVPKTSWAVFCRTALTCDPGRLYDARIDL